MRLDQDIEALREGCPERGVWFAGEHTAPFVALGTVTGAWWSGEGVAMRVAEIYGLGDVDAVNGTGTRVTVNGNKMLVDGEGDDRDVQIGKGAKVLNGMAA